MDKLLRYLNSLGKDERLAYVTACGTSEGYLRKAVSLHQEFRAELCILLERESKGAVRCEDLLPSADWAYIRAQATATSLGRRSTDPEPISGRAGRTPPSRDRLMTLSADHAAGAEGKA